MYKTRFVTGTSTRAFAFVNTRDTNTGHVQMEETDKQKQNT